MCWWNALNLCELTGTHRNATFSPLLFKKTADESWERGICIYEQSVDSHTVDRGDGGDVWLKWCKLLVVKPGRAAVALDQVLAPGDLSPLGSRPLNAEVRWDVFNVKSSIIRYHFADRYIPLDLRELNSFCLSKTPMNNFSCRLELKRPFPCDLVRLQSSLYSLRRSALVLLQISRHADVRFGNKKSKNSIRV